jgi:hypothetical protein
MSRSHKAIERGLSALAMAAAIAGSPSPLRAGEPPVSVALSAGDRIRLSTGAIAKGTTGRLVQVGPDVLRIQVDGRPDPIAVPLTAVTRLERSLGRRSSAGKGALIGTVVGTGMGAVLVALAGHSDSDCDGPCTPYAIIAGSAFIGAGALVGAIGGALIKTERWEPVSLGHIGVNVLPRHRGAALALSVRF